MRTPTHSLIQRRGAAELPASGIWSLHQSSHVSVSSGASRRRLAVSAGTLVVAGDPERSSLTIVAGADGRHVNLTALADVIHADAQGFSRWKLTGTLMDGSARHRIEMGMSYHGVHRRADQAWAWFTGRASTPLTRRGLRRARPDLTLEFDLLFDAPVLVPAHLAAPDTAIGRVA
jgi:hypothetical protein